MGTISAILTIKNIVLVTEGKFKKGKLSYLKILVDNVTRGDSVNEETSDDKIFPVTQNEDENEICFDIPKDTGSFKITFRDDLLPDLHQYQVAIQLMLEGRRKPLTHLDLSLQDIDPSKVKNKTLKSTLKEFQAVEIKYKLEPVENVIGDEDRKSHEKATKDSLDNSDIEKIAYFERNSCIIVVGTTGRGKTTTMNLYTGNTAETSNASHGTTRSNGVYKDLRPGHEGYPIWLDTIGLDEGGAELSNGDLIKQYLKTMQTHRIEKVHAIIWCITAESKVNIRLSVILLTLFILFGKSIYRHLKPILCRN